MKKSLMAVAFISAIAPAFASNLINNGGFETETSAITTKTYLILGVDPDPAGWTFTPSSDSTGSYVESNSDGSRPLDPFTGNPIDAQEGSWYLSLGAFDVSGGTPTNQSQYDSLGQGIQTTNGTTYNLSYYLWTTGGDYFNVTLNGNVVNGTQVSSGADSAAWVLVNSSFVGDGNVDKLAFNGFSNADYVCVDNISVTSQAVPEPTSLIGLGLGAVAVLRRRRK